MGGKNGAGQGLGSWFKTGLLCAAWASDLFHTILGHIHILPCVHVWCLGPGAGRNRDLSREDLVYSAPLRAVACTVLKDPTELSPCRAADHGRNFSVLVSGVKK